MNFNFFKNESPLYHFRWFITAFLIAAAAMLYCDSTGSRMFSSSSQQQWSSSGPGSHK